MDGRWSPGRSCEVSAPAEQALDGLPLWASGGRRATGDQAFEWREVVESGPSATGPRNAIGDVRSSMTMHPHLKASSWLGRGQMTGSEIKSLVAE
jgi:hypothetical protein